MYTQVYSSILLSLNLCLHLSPRAEEPGTDIFISPGIRHVCAWIEKDGADGKGGWIVGK